MERLIHIRLDSDRVVFFDRVSNTAGEMARSLGLDVIEVVPGTRPTLGECEEVLLGRDELSHLERALMEQMGSRTFDSALVFPSTD